MTEDEKTVLFVTGPGMTVPKALVYWGQWLLCTVTRTEMTEGGWKTMPHCCGQARCWMHINQERDPWCDCKCTWCKIARKIR